MEIQLFLALGAQIIVCSYQLSWVYRLIKLVDQILLSLKSESSSREVDLIFAVERA